MAEKKLFQNGRTKNIYESDKEDQLIIEFTDTETDFDGEAKAKFKDKGRYKNAISQALMEYLQGYNIPTHFKGRVNETMMRVSKLDMIPISVIVRNVAAGNLCRRFKLKKGLMLQYPVIEYYLRKEELKNPMVLESHAYAFGYATPDEMKHISRLSLKINAVLKSYLERRKLKLIDFKLEFGRLNKQVCLGDEMTPDTFRLWGINDNDLNEKQFSFENGKAQAAYKEIHERLIGKNE